MFGQLHPRHLFVVAKRWLTRHIFLGYITFVFHIEFNQHCFIFLLLLNIVREKYKASWTFSLVVYVSSLFFPIQKA